MSDYPEITAKIAEYNRTHDASHSPNSYRPWECDHGCSQCLVDEGADLAYKAVVQDLRDWADVVDVTAENAWDLAVATTLRAKADWYEQTKAPGDQMKKLGQRAQLTVAINALDSLAEWDHTGPVSQCDAPGIVLMARRTLERIRYGTIRAELPEGQRKPEERGET